MLKTIQFRSISITTLLLFAYVISIFSPISQLNNVVIMLLGINWILNGSIKKINQLLVNPVILFILLFHFLHLISLVWTYNQNEGRMWLEYRSPILFLPLILGTTIVKKRTIERLLITFALLTAAASVCGIVFGVIRTFYFNDSGYLYSDHLGFLIGKQAVYFAAYINFSIAILLYFISTKNNLTQKLKHISILSIIVMIVTSYLLASRIAMGVLILTLLGFIIYLIISRKQYLIALIMVFGMLLSAFMFVKIFPKTVNRFISMGTTEYVYDNTKPVDHFNDAIEVGNWNSLNTRLAAWSCVYPQMKKNIFFGTGIGDVQDELVGAYEHRKFYLGVKTRMNAHNQYYDVLLGFGVIGFVVFMAGFIIFPLRNAWVFKNNLLGYFIGATIIYFLTEVFLNRNQGIIFIVFFIIILDKFAATSAQKELT